MSPTGVGGHQQPPEGPSAAETTALPAANQPAPARAESDPAPDEGQITGQLPTADPTTVMPGGGAGTHDPARSGSGTPPDEGHVTRALPSTDPTTVMPGGAGARPGVAPTPPGTGAPDRPLTGPPADPPTAAPSAATGPVGIDPDAVWATGLRPARSWGGFRAGPPGENSESGAATGPRWDLTALPTWLIELGLALFVLVVGFGEAVEVDYGYGSSFHPAYLLPIALLTGAVACFRRRPGWAILLVAVGAALGFGLGMVTTPSIAVAIVTFGVAAFATRRAIWSAVLAGALLGLAAIGWILFVGAGGIGTVPDRAQDLSGRSLADLLSAASNTIGVYVVWGAGCLVLPWILGLATRSVLSARVQRRTAQEQQRAAEEQRDLAQRERAYAQEVADLKAGQAQLARDVHDVVGHSLAVILAQAESAQYIPDDDPAQMKAVMSHVATSARTSLRDVRTVLGATRGASTEVSTAGLDALVDGVRLAGSDVRASTTGSPVPLPPELDQVAYRVLQEMLTNALRHGRTGGPVWVGQEWGAAGDPDHLVLRVRNLTRGEPSQPHPDPAGTSPGLGIGLESMQHRVESVGGRLRVHRAGDTGDGSFEVTAWIPLRANEVR